MATEKLAHWAVNLSYSDLPPDVIQAAVRSFYNWAGCALGGSCHPTAMAAYKALAPFFGKPTSTLLGHKDGENARIDASHAALLNGIASHGHDYDDTHLETIIHPTGPVASALLAQSEAIDDVRGEDFVLSLVAGIEAECKFGLGVWPNHYDIGWHITSTTGSIGAAVAVGKLLKLEKEPMQYGIGIAATQVTGLREMFGSDTKSFHVGRAAQNGLMAAVLASNGYTSSLQALEAKRGWAHVVSLSNSIDEQISRLGHIWETSKNSFKPFSCGIVVHPVIDGCIQLHQDMKEQGFTSSDIKAVHAKVHPLVLELTGKKTPKDGLQAKFSVYHAGSVSLILGKAGPAQYEDKVVQSQEIVTVRSKIDATIDPSFAANEADIALTLQNGAVLTKHVAHAIGSLDVPMSDKQLEEKFLDQVGPSLGMKRAQEASHVLWSVASVDSVAEIARSI